MFHTKSICVLNFILWQQDLLIGVTQAVQLLPSQSSLALSSSRWTSSSCSSLSGAALEHSKDDKGYLQLPRQRHLNKATRCLKPWVKVYGQEFTTLQSKQFYSLESDVFRALGAAPVLIPAVPVVITKLSRAWFENRDTHPTRLIIQTCENP